MAAFYKVTLPADALAAPRVNGHDSAIVYAADEEEARYLVAVASDLDVNAPWLAADVTELSAPGDDYTGWTYSIAFENAAANVSYTAAAEDTLDEIGAGLVAALNSAQDLEGYLFEITLGAIEVDYTGLAGDTIDDVAAELVTALNATAINGAAYTAGTQTLTVAAAGDALGDEELVFTVTAPDSEDATELFAGTIVDQGLEGDAVTIVLINTGFVFNAAYNTGTNVLTVAGALDRMGDTEFEISASNPAYEGFDSSGFFTAQDDGGSAADPLLVTLVAALPGSVLFFKS